MSTVEELLMEAGHALAHLSDPRKLEDAVDAARTVGRFIAAEEQVRWVRGADETLRQWLTTPLDPGRRDNHAFMAGLVLARWSPPHTTEALISAATSSDSWCARMARLNLSWLAPSPENRAVLEAAIDGDGLGDDLPLHLLIDALVHQRAREGLPTIERYLRGHDNPKNRAWVLISLVGLMPGEGLDVAEGLAEPGTGALAVTAMGLRAAYGDGTALSKLIEICRRRGAEWHTALYWLGRVPHPEAVPMQVAGLDHPDPATRADLVNALALVGAPHTLRAVVSALHDEAQEVSDTALSHVAQLIGPIFNERSWDYDDTGRLEARSRDQISELAHRILASLDGGERFLFQTPLAPRDLIDLLYVGFLTSYTWFNLIAATGLQVSFAPRKNLLYNLEAVHALETWYHRNEHRFEPGKWYYNGVPLTTS